MGDSQNAVIRAAEQNARIIASQKKKKDGETKRAISAQKKADADAKRSAAAGKKSAGGRGGRGGRFRSVLRSAGYRAAVRGHRGIVIKSQKEGRGFKGLIDYADDQAKSPQLIFTNAGGDAHAAMVAMIRCANLRKDIEQPVGHITASLPPQIGRSEERWAEIAAELRQTVGLDDSHPCVAIRHSDQDHDHVHFIYSRINVRGEVFDHWGIKLRCAAAEQKIEEKFDLQLFPRDMQKKHVKTTKNEIEMGLRTGELPPRLQIAAALEAATKGRPTIQQFVERLQAAGVGVRANVSPGTGKMSGFSFNYAGIAFSGSQISKSYGWKALEGVIDYDQARDAEYLKAADGGTGRAGDDLAKSIAIIDGLDRAAEQVGASASEPAGLAASLAPAADRTVQLFNEGDAAPAAPGARQDASADRAADRDDLADATAVVRINRDERACAARADLSNDSHPLKQTLKGANDEQTRLFGSDNEDHGRTGSGSAAASTAAAAPAFTYIARPRPAAAAVRGVLSVSELAMARDAVGGAMLLRPDAQHRVVDEPAPAHHDVRRAIDPAPVTRQAKQAAKPAAPVRPINSVPAGFTASKPLTVDLQDWAARLPNRIAINRKSARLVLAGLLDDRSRVLAVSTNGGFAIPSVRDLTDEQIVSLLNDPEIAQPVRAVGTPDFCQRVEEVARKHGIKIRHDHQLQRAAEQQRQADEQREREDNLPVPEFMP